jgi:CubicO group peptidase (beta-lactamase class C family)
MMTTVIKISKLQDRKTLPIIAGFVKPGFEAVKEAFFENFTHRNELGAACAVYYHGEKVVDLWGGIRDKATGAPWEEDTMVIVFSTTKGMAGLAMALANSRGLMDYEERVSSYWPQFAQYGKERATVRQLLSHQAGLFALDAPVDRDIVSDPNQLAAALAQQKPGARQAYHAISLGFYESELLRRVDPQHRSLGHFFQDEIAMPLGLDFYIRLPEDIPNSRLATIQRFNPISAFLPLKSLPVKFAMMDKRSNIYRAMFIHPGLGLPFDAERVYTRNLEVPSQGGVGTARAIAQAYSVFATGGHELGLRKDTLQALAAPAVPPQYGFYDECLKRKWQLSLGFAKPSAEYPFGPLEAFGTPGAGGSFGFADPKAGLGYAYVMNRMSSEQGGDARDVALRQAMYRSIAK